jgi:tetratricopeptide (TPR) repeat protein
MEKELHFEDEPAITDSPVALWQLRLPVQSFVGRTDQQDHLAQAIRQAAPQGARFALVGDDGLGKTELAFAIAEQLQHDFPDAHLFLDMGGAEDAPRAVQQCMQQIVHAFDPQAQVSSDPEHLVRRYHAVLHTRRALILADNVHHPDQIATLDIPPGCALLITSTTSLDIPGLIEESVAPLPPTEAEYLLQTLCPHLAQDASPLAARCGGIPLALRMAAGILAANKTWPTTAFLEALANAAQSNPAPIEALFTLVRTLLPPLEQAALFQISIFPTSFDYEAALAVVNLQDIPASNDSAPPQNGKQRGRSVAPGVEQVLERLCAMLLVEYDPDDERYAMHPTLQRMARAQLDETTAATLRRRAARHYTRMAAEIEEYYLRGGDYRFDALETFDRERPHLEAGWNWAWQNEDSNTLLNYTCMIGYTGMQRYHLLHAFLPRVEQAHKAAQQLRRRGDECHALNVLGSVYRTLGQPDRAIELYQQALELVQTVKKATNQGAILRNMGNACLSMGDIHQAIKYYGRAWKIARKTRDPREECDALGKMGLAHAELDEPQQAINYYEQALVLAKEYHYRDYEAECLGNMGVACADIGAPERAIVLCEEALALARDQRHRRDEGYMLHFLGITCAAAGQLSRARDINTQALNVAREVGERRLESRILTRMGQSAMTRDNLPDAIAYLEQAFAIAQAINDQRSKVLSSWNLGVALVSQHTGPTSDTPAAPSLSVLQRAVELMQIRVAYERSINHPLAEEHATQFSHIECLYKAEQEQAAA